MEGNIAYSLYKCSSHLKNIFMENCGPAFPRHHSDHWTLHFLCLLGSDSAAFNFLYLLSLSKNSGLHTPLIDLYSLFSFFLLLFQKISEGSIFSCVFYSAPHWCLIILNCLPSLKKTIYFYFPCFFHFPFPRPLVILCFTSENSVVK